ncbi:MAG: phospholipase, partial [Planctomycetes bacterium]|nr:phospholipase [Planctomycetota bacterium]
GSGSPQVTFDYLLYLPETYSAAGNERFPLLLFLHGAGERGTDVSLVKFHGPPKLVEQDWKSPFIVVSPQCPLNQQWNAPALLALLDDIEKKYRVDSDRIYVTGLSMGGAGTWGLIGLASERFAAMLPICGKGNVEAASRAGRLPIWMVIGDRDLPAVVANNREIEILLKSKEGDIKLTIYSGVGHNSWAQTYSTPEFYDWLLRHRRSDR